MKSSQPSSWEICILAGGLSRRMGRDKSRLKLGARTILSRIRAEAKLIGRPVRVIRRDAVPRCGPLGGILTALQSTRAEAVLFLACDMPWVSADLMQTVFRNLKPTRVALFTESESAPGFPFVLRREAFPVVAKQISQKELSIHALAAALKAKILRSPIRFRFQLRNVNTPTEWERARREWSRVQPKQRAKKS